jgi:hypothetical protein
LYRHKVLVLVSYLVAKYATVVVTYALYLIILPVLQCVLQPVLGVVVITAFVLVRHFSGRHWNKYSMCPEKNIFHLPECIHMAPKQQNPCEHMLRSLSQRLVDRFAEEMNNEETRTWVKTKVVGPLMKLLLQEITKYIYMCVSLLVLMNVLGLVSLILLAHTLYRQQA